MGDIKVYDFKKNQKFSTENIRFLTLLCDEFCRTSNMQIHYELKNQNLKLSMDKTYQTTYKDYIEDVSFDCIVVEYKMEPLVDNLTLFIDKYSTLVMIDLILGGDGQVKNEDRELTNIDLELLQYLMDNLLKRIHIPEGCKNTCISEIHTNSVQYQKVENKEAIFTSTIDISLDNNSVGKLKFCIPYSSMESVLEQLISKKIINSNNVQTNEANNIFSSNIFKYIKDIEVDVVATLGNSKVNISDLLKIEEGDIILLNKKINEDIEVSIGNHNTYNAKPGLIGSKKGIEITDIVDREE